MGDLNFALIGRKLQSAPLSSPNGSNTLVYSHLSFDSMLIIIIAAFIVSLLFAWALKCLVSCAFSCNREAMAIHSSPDNGNHNYVKQINVKSVPTVLYSNMGSEVKDTDCPICLAEFLEGENLKIVPHCNHCFHAECIDKWLACNPSCPSCRQSLLQ